MGSPSTKTVKQLFALSRNQCAFPKCTVSIIQEGTNTVVGEICHIKARSPGGPRYDPSQTEEERHSFENLILMCSIHAKIIDEDVESYTVERLLKIKADHEQATERAISEDARQRFNQLLDERIRLIIEHERSKPEDAEQETSGPFALAQKLAAKKSYAEKRGSWFSSREGLVDTIDSINRIFKAIRDRYCAEEETFKTIGITLHQEQKLLVLSNSDFGCQIELKGFDRVDYYSGIPSQLGFELILFGKTPTRQAPGTYFTKAIERTFLQPDLSEEELTVWRDEKKKVYTENSVVENVFTLLLEQIEKGKPLTETTPGGRYFVNGGYVDAWGNPIDDEFNPFEEGGW